MIHILVFGLSTGIGGVETYLMNLYRNIDRSKIQFDFVISGDSCHYAEEIKVLGGEIFYITPKKDNVLKNVLGLIKILKKCRPTHHVVYFNLSALYYNLPFVFAKIFRFPIVISHAHNTRSKGQKKNLRYYLHCLNRIHVANSSNYLFACSKLAAEWVMGKNSLRKENFKIVPNAIPSEKYEYNKEERNSVRKQLGIRKEQYVIGNIGRITYQKNQLFLLDIFGEILKKNKDALLLLVGDGELRPKIEQKISVLGLNNNVIITGERADVPRLLQAMDTFVLPSNFEGFGIVLIEAQSTGLQCFASKDVVPNETNITGLVEFIELEKTSKQWADQIFQYSKGSERKDKIKEIKEAGYDIEELSSWFQKFIMDINGENL